MPHIYHRGHVWTVWAVVTYEFPHKGEDANLHLLQSPMQFMWEGSWERCTCTGWMFLPGTNLARAWVDRRAGFHHVTHRWCPNQPTRTPRVRRFGIFPSMQSTTKLEQIESTRDLLATRGKKSAQFKWAAHGLKVEPRKMRKRHSSMRPWCGSWSRDTMVTGLNSTT